MKKIIALDIRFLYDHNKDKGIGFYGQNLISKLIENITSSDLVELYLIGYKSLNTNLSTLGYDELAITDLAKYADLKFISLGQNQQGSNDLKDVLNTVDPDLFFTLDPTVKINASKDHYKKVINIINLLDLKYLNLNSQHQTSNFLDKLRSKIKIKKSENRINILNTYSCIVLPSLQNKLAFQKQFPEIKNIYVAYPGVDSRFFFDRSSFDGDAFLQIRKIFDLPEKYFFFNNSLSDKFICDQLIRFITKLSIYNKKFENVPNKVVIVGREFSKSIKGQITPKTNGAKEFLEILKKKNLLNLIITTDRVPDDLYEELLYFSTASLAFQSPSKFNMVLLNSMAAQVPIITNKVEKDADITEGNCIEYIDYTDESIDWNNIFSNINENVVKSEENIKVKQNLILARKFNWDATAGKIWDIFKLQLDITSNSLQN